MYPALMRGRKTAGPDGLRGSGSQHCGALLMRDDETECPDPGLTFVPSPVAAPWPVVGAARASWCHCALDCPGKYTWHALLPSLVTKSLNFGGAEGDRTPDLRIANATLSQLSYGPPCDPA